MKAVTNAAGVSLLCLAGWLAIASWACDKAGNSLAPAEAAR